MTQQFDPVRSITSLRAHRRHAERPPVEDPVVAHEFAFDRVFELAARPLGIRPDNCSVTVTRDHLLVRFGPWSVATALSNVSGASVTGPYALPKTIGPPHLSFKDRGLTFATNRHEGVCIRFERPVRGMDPLGLLRHPGLTVTVENPAGLAALLTTLAAEGVDRPSERAPGGGGVRAPQPTPPADEGAEPDEVITELHDDLLGLSAAQLRARARELGVKGTARMNKAQLMELLDESSRRETGGEETDG